MGLAFKNEIAQSVSANRAKARVTLHTDSVEESQRCEKGLRVKENELEN